MKLNQLREELGECIEKQDFERAAQLKADISHLDAERSSLLEDTEPRMEEVRTQRVGTKWMKVYAYAFSNKYLCKVNHLCGIIFYYWK